MHEQHSFENTEAWIMENKQESSVDVLIVGSEDEIKGRMSESGGSYAFDCVVEEGADVDVNQLLAQCEEMNFKELRQQLDLLTKMSDVNEELILRSEHVNEQQDRLSEKVMEHNELIQNERSEWQKRLAETLKRNTLFKNEAVDLQQKHRCYEVESEIIDQFHENVKPEIRELIEEIEECRERLRLTAEVTEANVEKIRKEAEALVDENCNAYEVLAAMKKELNDLKIGLLGDDTENEEEEESDGEENGDGTGGETTRSDVGTGDIDTKEMVSANSDDSTGGSKSFGGNCEVESKGGIDVNKFKPTPMKGMIERSISPETDKAMKSVEVNDLSTHDIDFPRLKCEITDRKVIKPSYIQDNVDKSLEKVHTSDVTGYACAMNEDQERIGVTPRPGISLGRNQGKCSSTKEIDKDLLKRSLVQRKLNGLNGLTKRITEVKEDSASVSVDEENSSFTTKGKSKTQIPKPSKRVTRSASRCGERVQTSTPMPNKVLLPRHQHTGETTAGLPTKTQSVGNIKSADGNGYKTKHTIDTKLVTKVSETKANIKVKDRDKPSGNTEKVVEKISPRRLPPIEPTSKVTTDNRNANVPKLPAINPLQGKMYNSQLDKKTNQNKPSSLDISDKQKLSDARYDTTQRKMEKMAVKTAASRSVPNQAVATQSDTRKSGEPKATHRKNGLPPVKGHVKVTRKCAQLNSVCFSENTLPPIASPAPPTRSKEKSLAPIAWCNSMKYNGLTPRDDRENTVRKSSEMAGTNQSAERVNVVGQSKVLLKRRR